MDNYKKNYIDESLIVNHAYYDQLKDQLTCPICFSLLNDPVMCSNCETSFCKTCLVSWLTTNEICPLRCPKVLGKIKDVYLVVKKMMDGLKLKCKYGCDVPLLSYNEHVEQCQKHNHEQIKCWNCGKQSLIDDLKIKQEVEVLNLRHELETVKKVKKQYVKQKEVEIEIIKYNHETQIKEMSLNYEKELLISRNELKELKQKNLELIDKFDKLMKFKSNNQNQEITQDIFLQLGFFQEILNFKGIFFVNTKT